jgi:hypothetical protein
VEPFEATAADSHEGPVQSNDCLRIELPQANKLHCFNGPHQSLLTSEVNDKVIHRFAIFCSIPAALGPGVHTASNRNENQNRKMMFLWSRERPVRRADNLTAICEPTVYTIWDP